MVDCGGGGRRRGGRRGRILRACAVSGADPLRVQAAEVFAADVAAGRLPSIRGLRGVGRYRGFSRACRAVRAASASASSVFSRSRPSAARMSGCVIGCSYRGSLHGFAALPPGPTWGPAASRLRCHHWFHGFRDGRRAGYGHRLPPDTLRCAVGAFAYRKPPPGRAAYRACSLTWRDGAHRKTAAAARIARHGRDHITLIARPLVSPPGRAGHRLACRGHRGWLSHYERPGLNSGCVG